MLHIIVIIAVNALFLGKIYYFFTDFLCIKFIEHNLEGSHRRQVVILDL
jgi:hypothetical protein